MTDTFSPSSIFRAEFRRICSAADTPPGQMRSYHSPEAGFAAYVMLTGSPKARNWLGRRMAGWQMETAAGKLLEWDSYSVTGSADDWHKLWGASRAGYGQNGFKIMAAEIFESLYTLSIFDPTVREGAGE